MNRSSKLSVAVVVGLVLVPAVPRSANAEDSSAIQAGFQPHVQHRKGGKIDWTAGYIIAHGKGIAQGVDDQNQLLSQRAATLDAAANALAIALGINVDANSRAGDVRDGRVMLKGVIKGHETVDVRWMPNETPPRSRVTLRVPLWGVKGVASVFRHQQRAAMRRPTKGRLPLVVQHVDVSDSVLVIDARGLRLQTCLYPVVTDDTGAVLHDVNRLKQTKADKGPVVRYAESDLTFEHLAIGSVDGDTPARPTVRLASYQPFEDSKRATTEAGSEPTTQPNKNKPPKRRRRRVVVKAVGASGQQKAQIVLTKEDAEKLRRSPEGANLLRAGRVIVVVDSAAAGIEGRLNIDADEGIVALSFPR